MIHIIIPVHNRIEYSKKCLESLDRESYSNWCVYFVDDGSTDGTSEWLSALERDDVQHIGGDGTLWWTGAMKLGVERVLARCEEFDYIMSLNNDLVLRGDTLVTLLDAINSNGKSICSSISISDVKSEIVMSSGSKAISWILNIQWHPFVGKKYIDLIDEPLIELDFLTGRSVIYPIDVFVDNNFDAVNFPHYGGDSEFSARAKRMGYKLLLIPKSAVSVHRDSTGLNPMDKKLSLREMISSLSSIRSTNNLATKAKLAMRVPPWYARPTYFIIGILKIFIQLIIGNYMVKRRGRK